MSIEGRKKLESLRDEIKAFVGTKVHAIFVSNTERDIVAVEERLLDDDVEKAEDIYTFVGLKGQRKVLKANITLFEDAVANLDNRIQELLDEENQTLRNKIQE